MEKVERDFSRRVSLLCRREVGLDGLEGFFDEDLAGVGADFVAFGDGAVASSGDGPFGGEIGAGAGELDDERLQRGAAGFHLDAVVGVQFEGIRGDGDVAEADDMEFHRVGFDVIRLLGFVAFDDTSVPVDQGLAAGLLGVFGDFGFGEFVFALRDFATGERQFLHGVNQGSIGVFFLNGTGVGFVEGGDDTVGNVGKAIDLTEFEHPFFGGLAIHDVGGLIACCSGPAEDVQPRSVFGSELFADLMPEVGIDEAATFDFLSGTGEVDGGGDEFIVGVPEAEDFDAVVFVTFEHAEVVGGGIAVHDGGAVVVNGTTVESDDSMSESPADFAGLSGIPGGDDGCGDALSEELDVFGRLHHAFLGDVVDPFGEDGAGVGVSGAKKDFVDGEFGEFFEDQFSGACEGFLGDGDEVAGDHDGTFEALIGFASFESEDGGGNGAFDAIRNAGIHLAPEGDGLVGCNADRVGTDVEFGGQQSRGEGEDPDQGGCGDQGGFDGVVHGACLRRKVDWRRYCSGRG